MFSALAARKPLEVRSAAAWGVVMIGRLRSSLRSTSAVYARCVPCFNKRCRCSMVCIFECNCRGFRA